MNKALIVAIALVLAQPAFAADAAATAPQRPAKPKIAALDYSGVTTRERAAELARADLVILGLWPSIGAARMREFVGEIKARNPRARVCNYTVNNEVRESAVTDRRDDQHPIASVVDAKGWWAMDVSKTPPARVSQSGGAYGRDINVAAYGAELAELRASADARIFPPRVFDCAFVDNSFATTRVAADWLRQGRNQPARDPAASAAWRAGHRKFIDEIGRRFGLPVIGNLDTATPPGVDTPEYAGAFAGGNLESVIGRSWSRESFAGFASAMQVYREALAGVRERGLVVFSVAAAEDDVQTARYGLGAALLDDGWYLWSDAGRAGYRRAPLRLPDFDAPLGAPAEPPPRGPGADGVWRRAYENGLVVVNPDKQRSVTVELPARLKTLDGQPADTVTLAPRDARLLIRR